MPGQSLKIKDQKPCFKRMARIPVRPDWTGLGLIHIWQGLDCAHIGLSLWEVSSLHSLNPRLLLAFLCSFYRKGKRVLPKRGDYYGHYSFIFLPTDGSASVNSLPTFATASYVLQKQWQDPVGDNRMLKKMEKNRKCGFKNEAYKVFTKTKCWLVISESDHEQQLLTGKTKVHSACKHTFD